MHERGAPMRAFIRSHEWTMALGVPRYRAHSFGAFLVGEWLRQPSWSTIPGSIQRKAADGRTIRGFLVLGSPLLCSLLLLLPQRTDEVHHLVNR